MLQNLHCNIKLSNVLRTAALPIANRVGNISQSAEPRPRPQYSKYTPDGTLISLVAVPCAIVGTSLCIRTTVAMYGAVPRTPWMGSLTNVRILEGTTVLPVTT